MSTGADASPPATVEAIQALLDLNPTAAVTALNANALLVPVPAVLRLDGQRVLESRSLIEWVVPADRAAVARAWFGTRTAAWVQAPVRLLSAPDSWVGLHLVNTLDTLGAVVAVIVPESVDGVSVDLGAAQTARSRLASYQQDNAGMITACDEASASMLGFVAARLVGSQGLDLVHPDDQPQVIEAWLEAVATKRPCTMRYRHSRGGDGWLWVDGTIHNFLGQADRDHILVELIDVSEAMAAKAALQDREVYLDRLAQALPVGVLLVDSGRRVVYANDRLLTMLGSGPTPALDSLLARVADGDRDGLEARLGAALSDGTDSDLDISFTADGGAPRRGLVSIRTLAGGAGGPGGSGGAIVCLSDTTESVRMREELQDRATFDVLTRCLNRASVMTALQTALTGWGAGETGVIFIDLDDFKEVNDRFGHATGDELLVAVTGRFRGCLRDGDVLGRLGGDEFLAVCRVSRPGELPAVAQRMRDALGAGVRVGARVIDSRASVGTARGEPGMSADDLVAMADRAMYRAKRGAVRGPASAAPEGGAVGVGPAFVGPDRG